ncbi:MAG TPA: AAA family ATPase [Cellulomonas sp.]
MTAAQIVLTDELRRALDLLDSGGNLFLTGKAGTGKSTLVRHYLASTDRRVVVAAPTGIAALNVEGYTIHRLLGLRPTTTVEDVRHGGYRPGRFATTLASLQTLVLDEASMIRADLFDMLTAVLERFGPRPGTPFGGVQLVLVGDLFQLPPVVTTAEADHIAQRYGTPYFFSAESFRREDFPTVALTTVFRQQGDQRLTAILNAIREGVLLDQARADLDARTDPDFVPPEHELWLTVAPTNSVVTARNRQRLDALPGPEHVEQAVETGDLSLFDPPAERTVRYKVGAQIMLLTNDPADRWVNGSIGRVRAIDPRGGPAVTVELQDGSAVTITPTTWEATRPVVEGGTLRHEVVGTYTQLPFRLAWAITIHKSQGQTLDHLVVDLSGGVFDHGQVYVALSRCTSLDGLVLHRSVLPKDLRTDRRVLRFLAETSAPAGPPRYCALGVLTVGAEGRMSRPRPVELAVAFDDGTALSTLVNPHRDLGDAREAFGIRAADVLLAPTLPEVWDVLAPLLAGCTPVGVGTDAALGLVDFELKRLGRSTTLPLAVDLPTHALSAAERADLTAGSALVRARAALRVRDRLRAEDPGATAFPVPDRAEAEPTYLLTRDPDAAGPQDPRLPTLAALLDVSRGLSAVLLADAPPDRVAAAVPAWPGLHRVVADRLASAVEKVAGLPPELVDRLGVLGPLLGTSFAAALAPADGTASIDAVLTPRARVCFTGEALSPAGRPHDREQMKGLARAAGLLAVDTVTRTRCDALVVAELGTQSGKARKAKEYGKPVLSAAEFFDWLDRVGRADGRLTDDAAR